MSLTLYLHPLSSFCHKVLIALYENDTAFEPHIIEFGDESAAARFRDLWPVGKIPVLRDASRNRTVPETSIIIEYLEEHFPGKVPLLPKDATARLEARLWDRFFDLYVNVPVQKIVIDRIRKADQKDPKGVEEAIATLSTAYDLIERQLNGKTWAIGDDFSIADCAASPALFYASMVHAIPSGHVNLLAYFERLLARPAFERALVEARPYFPYFPYRENLPARFLES